MQNGKKSRSQLSVFRFPFPVLPIVLLMICCHRNSDPLFGRWSVEKVNVEFDEHIATPEMIRQYGEMEKNNIIEITQDSTLIFISEGDTLKGRCSIIGSQLLWDGKPLGHYGSGRIQTESSTPMGKIIVTYSR